jgi:hypothetical protein
MAVPKTWVLEFPGSFFRTLRRGDNGDKAVEINDSILFQVLTVSRVLTIQ